MTPVDPQITRLEQKSQNILVMMIAVMLLLLIQLWLVTIALEAYLAADNTRAVPTFFASIFCFLLNLWLLKALYAVDRRK
jgi:Family of unknown function (DUF6755)